MKRQRSANVRLQLGSSVVALLISTTQAPAQFMTPIHGHYPPGQTGLRGAAFPEPGWSITDFNRFFSNLDLVGPDGSSIEQPNELRYANIAMVGWASDYQILGMNFGALVGIPFATGNLNPDDPSDSSIGLGDIIVTPISLSAKTPDVDYQLQFSVWTPSGEFKPGGLSNRGSGFWSLIYSAGLVWYPGGDRDAWSVAAMSRIEQNFAQAYTGITPGNNFDIDWGIGRVVRLGPYRFDMGVSGFGTWQITEQSSGANTSPYRYYGAGPEVSAVIVDGLSVRLRAQFEFGAQNVVEGNNFWVVVNVRL